MCQSQSADSMCQLVLSIHCVSKSVCQLTVCRSLSADSLCVKVSVCVCNARCLSTDINTLLLHPLYIAVYLLIGLHFQPTELHERKKECVRNYVKERRTVYTVFSPLHFVFPRKLSRKLLIKRHSHACLFGYTFFSVSSVCFYKHLFTQVLLEVWWLYSIVL